MPTYTCERCLKEFSQKSHYNTHLKRKTPCQNNKSKIEEVVEKMVNEKIDNTLNKKLICQSNKKNSNISKTMNKEYTIVETFVGCGGAHLGFKNNGFKSLLVNDIDKNMIDTLIKNNMIDKDKCLTCPIQDITKDILESKINEDVDVLFGGIVCKGFSLAGVRNPFDERNYLYIKQIELVDILKPKVSVIENVVGLKNMILYRKNKTTIETFEEYNNISNENKKLNGIKSSRRKNNESYNDINTKILKNKNTLKSLLDRIDKYKYNVYDDIESRYQKLGYKVYNKVLSADKYNGYTSRKRLIIVAVRDDINKEYHFPCEEKSYTLKDALDKIDYANINNPKNDIDNKPMNHNSKTIERFKYIPEGKNIAQVIDDLPEHLKISKFYSRGNTQRLDRNKPTPTLVPGHSNFPIHPFEHRSITVREAATITGFPLNYKFCGSHTSRCMQVGNAVPVYLADAISKSIKKIL